ncbi:MAG TPA: RagB/SusD family nutrient uptake outer membrane protein [Puia sp.]
MQNVFKYIIFPVLLFGTLASCHKLDVPVKTELTPAVFPQDSAQYVQAAGAVYVVLRGNYAVEYFFQQTYSTNEGIEPARGGNWYDGGQNMTLHYHSWTKDNGYINGNWTWLSTIIGTSNQTLSVLNQTVPAGSFKQTLLSEVKMVRAFAYFMMMDNYGNVPIDTAYGDFTPKPNTARAQVFSFIESEVKACLPYLNTASGATTYGRPNKYTAYALLAKMCLNAEYYTKTARYDDCIAACDSVINSGLYALEPQSSYLKMFYPTNGPSMKEFIFAIPYDPAFSNGSWPFRCVNIHARYDVPRSEKAKFSLPFTPSAPASTLPEFYANFNDPNDVRNGQWLTGLQFLNDGVTPVTVTTTKAGYDGILYAGDNTPYTYQVNLTPNVVLRNTTQPFDVNDDEVGWNMGYRNIKFYPDANSPNRNQNNDVPVFRYSDILLMKAEAILRGGAATLGQTALTLANQLRAERTTSAAWSNITLDSIYNERSREFAWEGWHRNDMIRFGKFEDSWGFKTDADVNHRIYPIPTVALQLNPALKQNTGY